MKTRWPAIFLSFSLLLSNGYGDSGAQDVAREVRTYLYRPGVFADRSLGIGLPSNPLLLQGYFWYVRLETSTRAFLGMKPLARFLQDNRVPGIDFTGDRTLTTADIERLFQADLWARTTAGASTYKFRFLKLAGTLVGDAALPTIGRLFDLEVLGLSDKVTDRGLPWLKSLIHLKVLELAGSGITDQEIAVLSNLVQLERLSLKGTRVSDEGLQAIAHLPLKQLELGPAVTDRGLEKIAGITTLHQLDLSQSRITRSGVAALSTLTGLHTLFLGPSVSDADVQPLSALTNLKRLDLTGARITDASVNILAAMPQLEELALSRTQIGNVTLEKLSRLPHLRYLEVSDTQVTPEAFAALSGFTALQVFSFSSKKRLIRRDIEPLAQLPILHSILINGILLGPQVMSALRTAIRQSKAWLQLVPDAMAAMSDDVNVEHILETASLPADKSSAERFSGTSGLERIHQAEASLDDVSGTPDAPKIQTFEENEKNFLGEITVGVVSSRDRNKKGS